MPREPKVFFHYNAERAKAILDAEPLNSHTALPTRYEPYSEDKTREEAVTALLVDLIHLEVCEKGFSFERSLRAARRQFRKEVSGK